VITTSSLYENAYDEAHAAVFSTKLPVFTEKLQYEGKQWCEPLSVKACMLRTVDRCTVSGMPAVVPTSLVEKGIEKSMRDVYAKLPELVAAFIQTEQYQTVRHELLAALHPSANPSANPPMGVPVVAAAAHADSAQSARPSDRQSSVAALEPQLQRRLEALALRRMPGPSRRALPASHRLPPDTHGATKAAWMWKLGGAAPHRWHERFVVLDASRRALSYYSLTSRGFAFRGDAVIAGASAMVSRSPLLLIQLGVVRLLGGREPAQAEGPDASGGGGTRQLLVLRPASEAERNEWIDAIDGMLALERPASSAALQDQAESKSDVGDGTGDAGGDGAGGAGGGGGALGRPRAAAELAATARGPCVEGYLTKRGTGFPYPWQRRYFVLDGGSRTLYYFEVGLDDCRPELRATLKGTVVLEGIRHTPPSAVASAARGQRLLCAVRPPPMPPARQAAGVAAAADDGRNAAPAEGEEHGSLKLGLSFLLDGSSSRAHGGRGEMIARAESANEMERWLREGAAALDTAAMG